MSKIKNEYNEYITKTFRIPTDINAHLDRLVTMHNTSVNKVVIQCLEFALANIDEGTSAERTEQG